jgi:hypothetical protein
VLTEEHNAKSYLSVYDSSLLPHLLVHGVTVYFCQALNFLVENFGLFNDLFPFPSILDAGYPVFDLHLANVMFNVILFE